MAQESGAERLLRPTAKAMSVGSILLPTLMVAVLSLAGCGGGSSATEKADGTSPSAGSSDALKAGGVPGSSSESETASAGSSDGGGAAAPGGDPSGGNSDATGGKHGPRVPVPKGKPEPSITPEQRSEATVASMSLQSPSLPTAPTGEVAALPSVYTCDGEGGWPQLSWQGVPQGTAELALFAMSTQPVDGKLFFDWAVAGIDPSLTSIEAGALPKGAVMGQNSFGKIGYEICPPSGSAETYIFALYALPKRLAADRGFDPTALREEVLQVSGDAGLMATSYARE